MKNLFFMATLVAVTIAGCKSQKTPASTLPAEVEPPLEGTYWKLVELNGKPVKEEAGGKAMFIEFDATNKRFAASAGCNNMMGGYSTEGPGKIKFSQVASTQMACPDMQGDEMLARALESADNFTIANGMLSLNKARMAPLARFTKAQKP